MLTVTFYDSSETPIFECFLDEQLFFGVQLELWHIDIVNYLVTSNMPRKWMKDDKACFLVLIRYFMWDNL